MNRKQLRLSRGLVALVGLVLVIGLVAYARSGAKTPQANGQPAPTPVAAAPADPVEPATKPAPVSEPVAPRYFVSVTPQAPVTRPAADPAPAPAPAPAAHPVRLALADTSAPVTPPPPAPAGSGGVLADAKAKIDANDPLGARRILNDALLSGSLPAGDAAKARQLLSEANQQVVFSARKFPEDPFGGSHTVQPGDKPDAIAAKYAMTGAFLCRINGITDPRKMRAGAALKVVKGPFHAVVTKSKFTLDLYLGSPGEKGSMYITTFPVGLGKDNGTPTGTWMAEQGKKLANPKFWGAGDLPPMEAGDPKNPLGKFWIGLIGTDGAAVGQQSYGIHGTIDPDSIGKMASLGCIRMRNEDVAVVFEMLVDGKSAVVVKD